MDARPVHDGARKSGSDPEVAPWTDTRKLVGLTHPARTPQHRQHESFILIWWLAKRMAHGEDWPAILTGAEVGAGPLLLT
jgi:hypothetical protein